MLNLSYRKINFTGFIFCVGLVAFAYYMQHIMLMEPCHLCMMQRLVFFVLTPLFLLAALHNPGRTGQRWYATFIIVFAILGISFASRQLWLQSLPADRVPACGPDLQYLLKTVPLLEVVKSVFQGSGECAQVHWRFLGLTIPGWSLISYVLLGGLGLKSFLKK